MSPMKLRWAGHLPTLWPATRRIDILVNNAGISKDALFLRVKPEMLNEMIDVNLKGPFSALFTLRRYMIKQRSGKIVTVSSIVGLGRKPGPERVCNDKGRAHRHD